MIVYHGSNSNFKSLRISKSLVKHNSTLLNEGLDYAETLFKSGNYHEALDTSINTIEKVEPGIYELLLKLYKEAK